MNKKILVLLSLISLKSFGADRAKPYEKLNRFEILEMEEDTKAAQREIEREKVAQRERELAEAAVRSRKNQNVESSSVVINESSSSAGTSNASAGGRESSVVAAEISVNESKPSSPVDTSNPSVAAKPSVAVSEPATWSGLWQWGREAMGNALAKGQEMLQKGAANMSDMRKSVKITRQLKRSCKDISKSLSEIETDKLAELQSALAIAGDISKPEDIRQKNRLKIYGTLDSFNRPLSIIFGQADTEAKISSAGSLEQIFTAAGLRSEASATRSFGEQIYALFYKIKNDHAKQSTPIVGSFPASFFGNSSNSSDASSAAPSSCEAQKSDDAENDFIDKILDAVEIFAEGAELFENLPAKLAALQQGPNLKILQEVNKDLFGPNSLIMQLAQKGAFSSVCGERADAAIKKIALMYGYINFILEEALAIGGIYASVGEGSSSSVPTSKKE